MEDILIIGGGIVGSLIAYECSKYQCEVTLLDKENDVANATTMANSAIIHAGYDPKEDTLKARLNVRGALLYPSLCADLKVDYQRIGSLVVASSEAELQTLKTLQAKAKKRGIETEIINQAEIRAMERNIADEINYALWCPTTAIVTPWNVAIAAMEVAIANHVKCELNQRVIEIEKHKDVFVVKTEDRQYESKMVINCAGLYADQINQMVTHRADFSIVPKKGEYFVLSKLCKDFVSHVIYPTPSDVGKGVLVVPTVHGNILLGPNASVHDDKDDLSTSQVGLDFVRSNINKVVKNVPFGEIIHSFSGNRPTVDGEDFVIEESCVKHFINVAAIDSPGLASAPAIAEYVMEQFILKEFELQRRSFMKHRQRPIEIHRCSDEEKKKYVALNPRYGEMVCRCEQVSAQEVIDCIRRGARSVVAVKKRVRPGMGKCQGGFCEPLVVSLLAQTLGISMVEVDYNQKDSPLLFEGNKGNKS